MSPGCSPQFQPAPLHRGQAAPTTTTPLLSIPLPPPNTPFHVVPPPCKPKSQECAAGSSAESPGTLPASRASVSQPALQLLCTQQSSWSTQTRGHHLSVNIKPAPLSVMFPPAGKKKWPQSRHHLPSTQRGAQGVTLGGALAQADGQSWLTQAQMPPLVSVSPGQPSTLQAALKSGPRPWQVTPAVTQAAPVKLCVLPPPAALLHAGMMSSITWECDPTQTSFPNLQHQAKPGKCLGREEEKRFSPFPCRV